MKALLRKRSSPAAAASPPRPAAPAPASPAPQQPVSTPLYARFARSSSVARPVVSAPMPLGAAAVADERRRRNATDPEPARRELDERERRARTNAVSKLSDRDREHALPPLPPLRTDVDAPAHASSTHSPDLPSPPLSPVRAAHAAAPRARPLSMLDDPFAALPRTPEKQPAQTHTQLFGSPQTSFAERVDSPLPRPAPSSSSPPRPIASPPPTLNQTVVQSQSLTVSRSAPASYCARELTTRDRSLPTSSACARLLRYVRPRRTPSRIRPSPSFPRTRTHAHARLPRLEHAPHPHFPVPARRPPDRRPSFTSHVLHLLTRPSSPHASSTSPRVLNLPISAIPAPFYFSRRRTDLFASPIRFLRPFRTHPPIHLASARPLRCPPSAHGPSSPSRPRLARLLPLRAHSSIASRALLHRLAHTPPSPRSSPTRDKDRRASKLVKRPRLELVQKPPAPVQKPPAPVQKPPAPVQKPPAQVLTSKPPTQVLTSKPPTQVLTSKPPTQVLTPPQSADGHAHAPDRRPSHAHDRRLSRVQRVSEEGLVQRAGTVQGGQQLLQRMVSGVQQAQRMVSGVQQAQGMVSGVQQAQRMASGVQQAQRMGGEWMEMSGLQAQGMVSGGQPQLGMTSGGQLQLGMTSGGQLQHASRALYGSPSARFSPPPTQRQLSPPPTQRQLSPPPASASAHTHDSPPPLRTGPLIFQDRGGRPGTSPVYQPSASSATARATGRPATAQEAGRGVDAGGFGRMAGDGFGRPAENGRGRASEANGFGRTSEANGLSRTAEANGLSRTAEANGFSRPSQADIRSGLTSVSGPSPRPLSPSSGRRGAPAGISASSVNGVRAGPHAQAAADVGVHALAVLNGGSLVHAIANDAHGVTNGGHSVTNGAHSVTNGAHSVTNGAHGASNEVPASRRAPEMPEPMFADEIVASPIERSGTPERRHRPITPESPTGGSAVLASPAQIRARVGELADEQTPEQRREEIPDAEDAETQGVEDGLNVKDPSPVRAATGGHSDSRTPAETTQMPSPPSPEDYARSRAQRRGKGLERTVPVDILEHSLEIVYYPFLRHLQEPDLLAGLLAHSTFADWLALWTCSRASMQALQHHAYLREVVLERFLGPVGYARWAPDTQEPLPLTLKELNAYMRGVSVPPHAYVQIAGAMLRGDAQPEVPRLMKKSTRAYNRVLLRLRAQAELEAQAAAAARRALSSPSAERVGRSRGRGGPPPAFTNGNGYAGGRSLSRNASRAPSPTNSAWSHSHGGHSASVAGAWSGHFSAASPLFRPRRAPLLRVFVPSPEGDWLSDDAIVEAENELKKAGVIAFMRAGDVVWDTAVGDEGNAGRLIWDGRYLIDLDYTYSLMGDIPRYLPSLAFPPSYFHRVVRIAGDKNPVVHLDVAFWASEIAANLQLLQDRIKTETPQGSFHTVVRWVHRSSFTIRHLNPPHAPVLLLPTREKGLADLQQRCKGGFPPSAAPGHALRKGEREFAVWRILRERSRPGEIWIRAVSYKERLTT
ncbi:hypothetical protein K488DRAFT_86387 [Vararia minispora EC-137]|uniref:Uncharacterized protein n=1 Tax=Vararia minispora EC-137 TaxID=1314806 RepID=A0ACB8QJ97_9AGAM|nr:hypothetical protein K488DRAFT_86387 [Vararia minispora EC-137]